MLSLPLLLAAFSLAASASVAQEAPATAPAAAPESESSGIEEIVVTARKREESAQDVPVAISAFSEEALINAGVTGVNDLERLVPNITVTETSGLIAGATLAFIRGIGNDPGLAQGVGLYIDDIYLNRAVQAQLEVSDIERIEVLKGPQGHLYGRNTIGGAIRYITRDPGEELRAHAEIKYGRFDLFEAKLSASGPLVDEKLGGSIAVLYRRRDGIQENLADGRDFWDASLQAYRGKLVFTPVESFRAKLAVDYVHDRSAPYVPRRAGLDTNTVAFLGAFASNANFLVPGAGVLPSLNDLSIPSGIDQVNTNFGATYDDWFVKAGTAALTLEWDVTETITLKSVSSGRWGERIVPFDFDGSNQVFINTVQDRTERDYTTELQANFDIDGVHAVGGFFYLSAWDDQPGETDITARLTGGRRTQTITRKQVLEVNSWAIYGSTDIDLGTFVDALEGLQISVGGRFTDDDYTLDRDWTDTLTDYPLITCVTAFGCTPAQQALFIPLSPTFRALAVNPAMLAAVTALPGIFPVTAGPGGPVMCGLPPSPLNCGSPTPGSPRALLRQIKTSDSTRDGAWNVRVAYSLLEDLMVYVGAGSGYKQGGFNPNPPPTQNFFGAYKPEEVITTVAGFKSTWFDGTLRVNAEGFYNDYTDKQLGVIRLDPNTGSLLSTTENAGVVHSYGIDLETMWLTPLEGLTLALNFGWLEADFIKFLRDADADAVTPGIQPVTIDVADDNRLGYSPKWTVQPRALYELDLGGIGSLTFSTDVSWRSRSFTDSPMPLFNVGAGLVRTPDALTPFRIQKAHTLWNASVAWRSGDGNWRVALEGKNLLDRRVQVNSFEVGPIVAAGFNPPRMWIVSAGYDY
jgi:iron complex outermembrane receptor protein